jgi:hypothetical protein
MRTTTTLIFSVFVAVLCAPCAPAQTWTTISYPGSIQTQARGISGNKIVGNYVFSFSPPTEHGFVYDGSNYVTIDDPAAYPTLGTIANDIAANGNIVGFYYDGGQTEHGFLYNGSTYTTLNAPAGINGTLPFSISSNSGKIVGYYRDSNYNAHGFSYNGTSYTTLNDPLASNQPNQGTFAIGVAGDNAGIVGFYVDAAATQHGFLYNGSTYSTLDFPGSLDTDAFGIYGSAGNYMIVGGYIDAGSLHHGFLYSQSTSSWTTLDFPPTRDGTVARAIDGNNIVGEYYAPVFDQGFLLTVPEPSALVLLAIGGFLAIPGCLWAKQRRAGLKFS